MAGIYIHVPFCKQACNYCNFYFSTSTYFMEEYLQALLQEIEIQNNYLADELVNTIYFGGGTPSMLTMQSIEQILKKIQQHFKLNTELEICLEANPDDLNAQKLEDLKLAGINRLSIGTQSFQQVDLDFMHRPHNVKQAIASIENAHSKGFKDLSIDLIYGVPSLDEKSWRANLKLASDLGINHLSCYALTVEEGTALFHQIRKGKAPQVLDEKAAIHFKLLQDWAENRGWEHYEISNLCKSGNYSKHNTSYWKGVKYLGLGPAAHSFNGSSRQWNVANLKKYIARVKSGSLACDTERLTRQDLYNEYIMTGIRTQWGISKLKLKSKFLEFYPNFKQQLSKINSSWIVETGETITLSNEGKFYADGIASDLFMAK